MSNIQISRRTALLGAAATASLALTQTTATALPPADLRRDQMARFRKARYGLFIHYGPAAIHGKEMWWMYYGKITPSDFRTKYAAEFDPNKFDADKITDLALAAGMGYITLVTRHHDSYSLWPSHAWDLNIGNSPKAKGRDLVGEVVAACKRKGLMIFLYYSIGIDWSHPFFMPRSMYPSGRPDYAIQPPEYRWKSPEDSVFYRNYMMAQITELCTWYGDIDGFWFDPIGGVYAHPELFRVDDIYALIRKLQPQALIGYKTGYDGTEDFVCSEREPQSLGAMVRSMNGVEAGKLADAAWDRNKGKPLEICDTFQDYGWSYVKTSKHRDAHWLWKKMGYAAALNANFLVNTGPVADGSIYPADEMALREIGRRLKKEGWPKPDIDGSGPKAAGPKTAG